MSSDEGATRDAPHLTPARRAEHAARDRRLSEALRENLRRRKEQARVKESGPAPAAAKAAAREPQG
jgi:hypothetical protein